ncbi:MAG: hypothetical protein OFPII_21910 [Osedax symbiont Rs1]|nr:MAG: hypothetical protein OFPII_21910 [Osedax symbiont Rs1]
MNKREFYHWTQDPCLYIELMFKREFVRGFRAIDQHKSIDSLKILDAGCGAGQLSRELAEYFAVGNVYGCDIDEQQIESCQLKNPAINYFSHDLLTPLVCSVKFDIVFFTVALAQFTQSEQAIVLKNAKDSLSDRGFIWIVDVNNAATLQLFKSLPLQHQVVYRNSFSKCLFNRVAIMLLANRMPLTLLRVLEFFCVGSNSLTQLIIRVN